MLIELHRKEARTDCSVTCCAICGDDFDRGSVSPVIFTDQGEDVGDMCPTCLDYLNRRKNDPDNPDRGNFPARNWPALEDLEDARRRHPDPLFETMDDLCEAAAVSPDAEWRIMNETVVWKAEREKTTPV